MGQDVDASRAGSPRLPQALMPLLVKATDKMLRHSDAAGRLLFESGDFDERNWFALAALAAVWTRAADGNPYQGDARLADLIRRAGRTLAAEFDDPACVNLDGFWHEPNRLPEWVVEHWLLAYDLLTRAGAGELAAGWDKPLRRAGETLDRYCRQAEHLVRMTSPNLKISTNHFAYFAADLIRIGQLFGVEEYVQRGLLIARRIAEHQHPNGYWAETHGPTTSYNQITVGAMGLCDVYTGEPIFERVLRRALDFHLRFSYPDGVCLDTIDQRVRYPSADSPFALAAFSRWPDGRGWAELRFAHSLARYEAADSPGIFGRLASAYVYYRPGPVEQPLCARPAYSARLSDLPGGLARDRGWLVALCGIPSRPRNHFYTMDRQNLLTVWHERSGLILGGGNNRDDHTSATFYARIMNDPAALVGGITHEDAYVPVDSQLTLDEAGGSLDLEYWGFDAKLSARIVDDRTVRLTAFAGTLPVNDPILFNPNVVLDADQPVRTASGLIVPTGQAQWQLNGGQLGGWFGQGDWRIEVPADCTLRYPLIPFRQNPKKQVECRLAVLSVPVTNRTVELTVRVGG